MRELLRAFIEISLWRKGPQHLPHSMLLFVVTMIVYFAVAIALSGAMERLVVNPDASAPATAIDPGKQSALATTSMGVGIMLAWLAVMLLVVKRSPRFYQTATAVLGIGIVIGPLATLLPALCLRIGAATAAAVIEPVILAWYLLTLAQIIRNALDIRLLGAVLLTGGYVLCQYVITVQLMNSGP